MSERCGNLETTYYSEEVQKENRYCGVTAWNEAGYKGRGVVIWNMEQFTDHGCQTHDRVLDAAPEATVLNAFEDIEYDNGRLLKLDIWHEEWEDGPEKRYGLEEFIEKFNVKIINRSMSGSLASIEKVTDYDRYWLELKKKYNLIMFNSAGNDAVKKDNSGDISIIVQAGHLDEETGKPVRDGYSNLTNPNSVVFTDFRGWNYGTSFSSPYLAGKTALLVEKFGNHITQEQVVEYWIHHAEDMDVPGFDERTGYGLPILGDPYEKIAK